MDPDDWKREAYLRLLKEKNDQIERKEKERLDWIEKNRPALEQEAILLLKETEVFDPDDIWQYKKGLRLTHIGSLLGNDLYKEKGMDFYRKEWNSPPIYDV